MRDTARAHASILVVAVAAGFLFAPDTATQGVAAKGDPLRVLTTRSIATVLEKIGSDFERRTGRKLSITTDVAARLVRRIDAGEPFDFLVASPTFIDELIAQGKTIPETRTDVARSGIGVAVRAGAPKPDVSSVEAFKRALLAAKSIARPDPSLGGSSGVYIAQVLERLGIAEALRSRTILASHPDREQEMPGSFVASGRAEIALHQIQELIAVPGLEIVGPLPGDLKGSFLFSAGILAGSTHGEAARQLLDLLKRPATLALIKGKGMEPAAR